MFVQDLQFPAILGRNCAFWQVCACKFWQVCIKFASFGKFVQDLQFLAAMAEPKPEPKAPKLFLEQKLELEPKLLVEQEAEQKQESKLLAEPEQELMESKL